MSIADTLSMTTEVHCSATDYYSPHCCSSKLTTAATPTEAGIKEPVIIGASVGGFVLCIVAVAVLVCEVCCICRRRRRRGIEIQPVATEDNSDGRLAEGHYGPNGYGTFDHNTLTPTSLSSYSDPRDAVATISQEDISLALHRDLEVEVVSGEAESSTEPADKPVSEPRQRESLPSTGGTGQGAMAAAVADTAAQVSCEGRCSCTTPALGSGYVLYLHE